MATSTPQIWEYGPVPTGFWTRWENRHAYMFWLEQKLKIRDPEDWYEVTGTLLNRFGGSGIRGRYHGSVIAMIMDYLPWYDWKEWLFSGRLPRNFWKQPENQRRYLDWLGEQLGFEKPEDWFRIKTRDFLQNHGDGLVREFDRKIIAIVRSYMPEYEWLEWLFPAVPYGFWADQANRRSYMHWLMNKLGFEEPEDLYSLTNVLISRNHGATLIGKCGGGPYAVVSSCMPEYEWLEWHFIRTPSHFWKNSANRRRYLDWLGEQLGFEEPQDWYNLSTSDLQMSGGAGLLKMFNYSPSAIVIFQFPQHERFEWLFAAAPSTFWTDPVNQRRYMDWLGEKLGFKEPQDWYKFKSKHLIENHGAYILGKFGNTPSAVVKACFPEHEWLEWLFPYVSDDFWADPVNQRRYLDWLSTSRGFKKPEDFYKLTRKYLEANHGRKLSRKFNNTPFAIMKSCFPEYEWLEWRFKRAPRGFWGDPVNQRRYLDWLGKRLGFKEPEDWYKLQSKDLIENQGSHLFTFHKEFSDIVRSNFPEHEWLEWLFGLVPDGFWNDPVNRRSYLDWLGEKLEFKKSEDWYKIKTQDFKGNYGGGLLARFKGSRSKMLKDYMSEYDWKEWLFSNIPLGFWKDRTNRRRYLEWLADRLSFEQPEDWSRLRAHHLLENRGVSLLNQFHWSIEAIVRESLPPIARS